MLRLWLLLELFVTVSLFTICLGMPYGASRLGPTITATGQLGIPSGAQRTVDSENDFKSGSDTKVVISGSSFSSSVSSVHYPVSKSQNWDPQVLPNSQHQAVNYNRVQQVQTLESFNKSRVGYPYPTVAQNSPTPGSSRDYNLERTQKPYSYNANSQDALVVNSDNDRHRYTWTTESTTHSSYTIKNKNREEFQQSTTSRNPHINGMGNRRDQTYDSDSDKPTLSDYERPDPNPVYSPVDNPVIIIEYPTENYDGKMTTRAPLKRPIIRGRPSENRSV